MVGVAGCACEGLPPDFARSDVEADGFSLCCCVVEVVFLAVSTEMAFCEDETLVEVVFVGLDIVEGLV